MKHGHESIPNAMYPQSAPQVYPVLAMPAASWQNVVRCYAGIGTTAQFKLRQRIHIDRWYESCERQLDKQLGDRHHRPYLGPWSEEKEWA